MQDDTKRYERKTSAVACDAKNCEHNTQDICTASHVNVRGKNANSTSQTSCETFSCKSC